MKLPAAISAAVLLVLAVVLGAALDGSDRPGDVELARLTDETWKQFAPDGKETDAIYGDLVLRNQYLTAVIARPVASRNANMTVRNVAGALIDLTTRESPSDQLSAFYPGRRKYPFRSWSVQTDDGKPVDGDQAAVHSGRSAVITVQAEPAEGRPRVEVTYRLEAKSPYLTVETRFVNTADKPLEVPLQDDARIDTRNEDIVKASNGTAQLFWIHDRFWGQAYGVTPTKQFRIRSNSNSRDSVLTYETKASGTDTVTLPPEGTYQLTRRVFPGSNLLDVRAVAAGLAGQDTFPVRFRLHDGDGKAIPQARLEVFRNGETLGTATADAEGRVHTALQSGEYRLAVSVFGVPLTDDLAVSVAATATGNRFDLALKEYRPGEVEARITDADGEPIPCKLEFVGKGQTPTPDFGPETAEFAVKNLRYAPLGKFTQKLAPGRYEVIVSHGPEFDAIFTELTVPPGKTVPLTGKLDRTVQTPGWVSSDFHSHSSPSGDNTSSQLGRVLNLLCEHIEFAPCTEHNRLDTYIPHIERLGVEKFIATTTGIELTGRPGQLNHQNAFPLIRKPRTQDGGAPLTDENPETQIERLALWDNRSEKLVQQNHPDIGWLFYDKNGDGEPDAGFKRSIPYMDVIEIHPIGNALYLEPFETRGNRKGNNRVFNWLQLLNQGYRIPGVVNTDAHYNFHGSGGLRNWIQSSTDDPARIDTMEMVRAAEAGRLILSNGPYLEVTLWEHGRKKRVSSGGDLQATSSNVVLHARVQCPNWFDVNELFVLVNGRKHPKHIYTRSATPDRFRSGTVKFDEKLPLKLNADAHIVVVTGGRDRKLGKVLGSNWGNDPPTALSNPIFVDVDGDGFRPNNDTLDHPLPVKFGAGN